MGNGGPRTPSYPAPYRGVELFHPLIPIVAALSRRGRSSCRPYYHAPPHGYGPIETREPLSTLDKPLMAPAQSHRAVPAVSVRVASCCARCMYIERYSAAPILPSYWRTSWQTTHTSCAATLNHGTHPNRGNLAI